MKKDIHPPFHKTVVHCACGNEFETYSTAKELKSRYVLSVTHYTPGNKKL